MFERFTERARQTIVFAQQNARDLKHQQIGTGDALLGILQEEEGLGARTLRALGLTYEAVVAEVAKLQPPEGDGPAPRAQVPFTDATKKAYELALREALSLGHNYIGTEHLLLGLVRISAGVHATVLEAAGLDSEKIRREIIRTLSGPAKPKEKPATPIIAADLMRIGDRLQSEASRVAEYLKGEKLPYEIAMAVAGIEAAVGQWTEARRAMGVQRAA